MRYSQISTIQVGDKFGCSQCLTSLNDIIIKDGCLETMPVFNENDITVDMDCVESTIAKRQNRQFNKSMDALIVIINTDENFEIVFVEFRFNYTSMRNLRAKDLRGKKEESQKLVNNFGFTNIHKYYYYIFNPNLKEQARRQFRNLYPSMPNSFIPITIFELKNKFFSF